MFWKKGFAASTVIVGLFLASFAFADADPSIPTANTVPVSTTGAVPVVIPLSGTSSDSGTIDSYATTSSPVSGTLGTISGNSVTYTPQSGFTGNDSFQYIVTEGATSSAPATVSITVSAPAVTTGTAHVTLRDGSTVATSSDVSFALSGNTTLATTLGETRDVAASSTLAALVSLDGVASEFSISDLQYNTGFASFYLRCITLTSADTGDCDNWQYAVNGISPSVGMDKYVLHDGDIVYVYFGSPRIVALSSPSVIAGAPVTATAEQYDPVAGAYNPVTGYTIGATQPDPNNPWNPIEIATSTVDANGQAIFTLNATGTYQVGLKEDFYFPTTDLTVTDPTPTAPMVSELSGGSNATPSFSIVNALAFVSAHQNPDGSFSSPIITDWTALAFAAANPGAGKTMLTNYLTTQNVSLSSVLDYERHTMALEALGIDPYSGGPTNYISPIVTAFDGTQIGSPSLVNDDIFALVPLLHAGYSQSDSMIQEIAAFIISKQKIDGSWEESADLTGAAIQALGPLYTVSGYGPALGKASGYLATTQQSDGGWNNVDSTSWVLTAINAVNESDPAHASNWTSLGNHVPLDSLAGAQQNDGAVRQTSEPVDTRTWSTAYAIVAVSGKSWLSLLQNFSKPAPSTQSGSSISGGSNEFSNTATSSATTTATVATSTSAVASSTRPVIASSTPELIATSTPEATATPQSSPAPKKKKTVTVTPTPSPAPPVETPVPETQTAAAAGAGGGLFFHLWSWITGFFAHVF